MSKTLDDEVRQVASDVLNVSPAELASSAPFEQTVPDWSSLGFVTLVAALEESFSVQFLPEEAERMRSVGAIVEMIEQKRAESE